MVSFTAWIQWILINGCLPRLLAVCCHAAIQKFCCFATCYRSDQSLSVRSSNVCAQQLTRELQFLTWFHLLSLLWRFHTCTFSLSFTMITVAKSSHGNLGIPFFKLCFYGKLCNFVHSLHSVRFLHFASCWCVGENDANLSQKFWCTIKDFLYLFSSWTFIVWS